MPMTGGLVAESGYRIGIAGHGVIGHVPAQDTSQPAPLYRDGIAPTAFELHVERFQLRPLALGDGDTSDPDPPGPGPRADMREPQEIERLRPAQTPPRPIPSGVPPELDQPRLVRMQAQPELRQPPAKLDQEPPRIILMLKPDNKIVSETHN